MGRLEGGKGIMKWDKEAAAADTQRRKRRRKDEITEIQKKK